MDDQNKLINLLKEQHQKEVEELNEKLIETQNNLQSELQKLDSENHEIKEELETYKSPEGKHKLRKMKSDP